MSSWFYLTNTALSLSGKIEAGFWVIFLWATPTPLWFLLYSTIVLYDTSLFGFCYSVQVHDVCNCSIRETVHAVLEYHESTFHLQGVCHCFIFSLW